MRMLTDLLKTFGIIFVMGYVLMVYADWRGSFDEPEREDAEWQAYSND